MLTTDWEKTDKFYIILVAVLVTLSVLLVFSFRGVFSAFLTSYEIDQAAISSGVKIQEERLDEVYSWVFNKERVPLELTN